MMNLRKQLENRAIRQKQREATKLNSVSPESEVLNAEDAKTGRAPLRGLRLRARRERAQPLKTMEDSALVEAVKAGNKEAFGELYERYVEKIYNYIFYRTGNHHDAEDLTARVFFRAMGHIETYTDRGVPFQAWLYRIAHNLVANWHRDRGRRKVIPLDEFLSSNLKSDSPDQQAEDNEERSALLAAVRRMPEERQQLLILKFVEHRSNAEIGQMMDRTEGAIKSLYHRTLLALRDELTRQDAALHPRLPADALDAKRGHTHLDADALIIEEG